MPFVDNVQGTQAASVALTTTETSLFPASFATGFPIQGSGPGRASAAVLAVVTVPNVTGLATTAAVTVNVRSGTTIGGTLIGSATATNSGAGASAEGPVTLAVIVPAGTENVFVGALTSSGTGSAVASATAPIVFCALFLD